MGKKILIIDDDPAIVSYLEDVFRDAGYETCTAQDGSTALPVAQREMPDLITLDLQMPGEWGPRFFRNLSQDKACKNIPVIVISGLIGNRCAILNAVASFTKPFDPECLVQTVRDIIG